jgi:pSer/pThr/pTyr-binding forkhead associated (FHA) protein
MISQFSVFNEQDAYWVDPDMKQLRVGLVNQDGSEVPLGVVDSAEVFIGREPGEGGITVDNSAVSRQHGLFFCGREQWLFKDLGSTNGTWHNGLKLKNGAWRILREGDLLQLADSVLRMHEQSGAGMAPQHGGLGGRALIVFAKGEFAKELSVPEYGRALVVGGSRADLPLDGDLAELPTLVIERRGEKICAFGLAREQKVYINDREMAELVALKDSDEIRIGQYSILFSDPASIDRRVSGAVPGTPQRDPGSIAKAVEQTSKLTGVRDWGSGESEGFGSGKAQSRMPFGQVSDTESLDETQAIDSRAFRQGGNVDRHPGLRFADEEEQGSGPSLEALEDKVIVIIGGVLVVTLLVLLVWWFLG